jgi:hypothetical protein
MRHDDHVLGGEVWGSERHVHHARDMDDSDGIIDDRDEDDLL